MGLFFNIVNSNYTLQQQPNLIKRSKYCPECKEHTTAWDERLTCCIDCAMKSIERK